MPAPCCTLGCQLSLLCNEGFSLWFWVVGVGGKKASPPTPVSSVAGTPSTGLRTWGSALPFRPRPCRGLLHRAAVSFSLGVLGGAAQGSAVRPPGRALAPKPRAPRRRGRRELRHDPLLKALASGSPGLCCGGGGQEPAVGDVGPRSASGVSWLLGLHPAPGPSAVRQGVASLFSSGLTLADCPPAQCPVGVKGNPGPAPGKTLWAPGTSCLT